MLAVLLAAFEFAAPRASVAQNAQQPPAPQQPIPLTSDRGFGTPAAVLENAAVFLLPDATRLPLRIAQAGSQVRVIRQAGEWSTVQFQDPEYGLRTGYIQSRFLRLQPTGAAETGGVPSATQPPAPSGPPIRSESTGFFVGGGFEGASIDTNDSALDSKSRGGVGGGFEAGYGVSRLLAIYGAFSAAGINGEADTSNYSLKNYDIGARIHFAAPPRRTVAFLQAGFSWRAVSQDLMVDSFAHTLEASGPGASFGGGVNVHITPAFAVSTSASWTVGDFTSYQFDNQEIVVDSSNTTSARFHIGVVWFPRGARVNRTP
jgi:hypothetical protein